MRIVSVLIGIAVVVGVAWYFVSPASSPSPSGVESAKDMGVVTGTVEVVKTSIAETGGSKLPVGFPKEIPVEASNISESYRAVYASKGVTQYTVSYTSLEKREELWMLYSDFMQSTDYEVDTNVSSKSLGQITGTKNNDTLSAVVSVHGGLSLVQLNFLDRQ